MPGSAKLMTLTSMPLPEKARPASAAMRQ